MLQGRTVAVLSDIHGNLAALEAVLNNIESQNIEEIVVAGDLLAFGLEPFGCLALLLELDAPTIRGNTEWYLTDGSHEKFGEPAMVWVRERIEDKGMQYLAGLEFDHRITPPGGSSPDDDLLVVHASPTDVESAPLGFGPVDIPSTETRTLIGDANANLILFGHIHFAVEGQVRGQRLSSIGSVGLPFDGDHRAAYALVSWDGELWSVAHQRVMYDYQSAIQRLETSDAPFAERSAGILRSAKPPQ